MREYRAGIGKTAVAKFPWPDDCHIQGGDRGVVFAGERGSYVTAFFEAFPRNPNTFLRAEADTVQDAEEKAWARYQVIRACGHPRYEKRGYTNGAGFCTKCGMFACDVFEPEPEDPNRPKSRLERMFENPVEGIGEVIDALEANNARPE